MLCEWCVLSVAAPLLPPLHTPHLTMASLAATAAPTAAALAAPAASSALPLSGGSSAGGGGLSGGSSASSGPSSSALASAATAAAAVVRARLAAAAAARDPSRPRPSNLTITPSDIERFPVGEDVLSTLTYHWFPTSAWHHIHGWKANEFKRIWPRFFASAPPPLAKQCATALIDAIEAYAAAHPDMFAQPHALYPWPVGVRALLEPESEPEESDGAGDVPAASRRSSRAAAHAAAHRLSSRSHSPALAAPAGAGAPPRARRTVVGGESALSPDGVNYEALMTLLRALPGPSGGSLPVGGNAGAVGAGARPAAAHSARTHRRHRRSPPPASSGSSSSSDGSSTDSSDSSYSDASDDDASAVDMIPSSVAASRSRGPRSSPRARSHQSKKDKHSNMDKRFVKTYIRNVLGVDGASLSQVFRQEVEFTNLRNRKECLTLARIADYLRQGEVDLALEATVRRLAGVSVADKWDSWETCNYLEKSRESHSFIPERDLRAAMKSAATFEALRKKDPRTSSTTSGASQSSSRRKQGGGVDSSNPPAGGGKSGSKSGSSSGQQKQ